MPIYNYECLNCKTNFEKFVPYKFTMKKCPKCGSTKIERVWSVPAKRNPDAGIQR